MKNNDKKISVIVPVYNEESAIFACLDALSSQTIKPYEIIVVDNNSTDNTALIAMRFKNVRVINQPKQGLSFARNLGFDTATGDILARIDADTVVPTDWIRQISTEFDDSRVSAITGFGRNRVGILQDKFSNLAWNYCYYNHCRGYFGIQVLWGANMALRRTAWYKAKSLLLNDDNRHHEDQELSLALTAKGIGIKLVPSLVVSVDYEGMEEIGKYLLYLKKKRTTRADYRQLPIWPTIQDQQLPSYKRFGYQAISTPTFPIFGLFCTAKSTALWIVRRGGNIARFRLRSEP